METENTNANTKAKAKETTREPEGLIILGPTGIGKTGLAVRLAQRLGAEIISADSRSFYKGLEIGTAKPTPEQRQAVPHHLIDIKEPHERYDVMQFRRDVARLIEELRGRGKIPLIVGGSTLYVEALLGKFFPGPGADLELRRKLASQPLEGLYARLKEVDPVAAERINEHDRQRIVRALEVYELTGRPLSELQRESEPFPYRLFAVGLTMDRGLLYKRINRRVEEMVAAGLVEEARALWESGAIGPDSPAAKTIGYQELFAHFAGEIPLERAIELIKRNTRRLAKRQLAFFKRLPGVHWLEITHKPKEEVIAEILALLHDLNKP